MDIFVWQSLGLLGLIAVIAVMYRRQQQLGKRLEARQFETAAQLEADPEPPKCANCAYFDLEEGQAQIREHPAFLQVTDLVSPAKMSRRAQVDGNGNMLVDDAGHAVMSEPTIARKVRWDQFGACSRHQEGRHQDDTCGSHAADVPSPTPSAPPR